MASEKPSDPESRSSGLIGKLLRNWRGSARRSQDSSLRESIAHAMEEHGEPAVADLDDLSVSQRLMLRNLLDYGDLSVGDVMVPRADIEAFNIADGFDELVAQFARAGHSRLPVYRESLDAIIGMAHVKDVYRLLAEPAGPVQPRLDSLLRSVLFVPPSMRVLDLLTRMRASRTHMAIVVDEYGGTDGLATIEDLVEQIVGEIDDEHDEAEAALLRPLPDGSYDADARLPLEDLEAHLKQDFLPAEADEEVDTLGGLLFFLCGRVPVIGEVIEDESGYRFEVVDGDPRRITRVRIHPPKRAPDLDDATG